MIKEQQQPKKINRLDGLIGFETESTEALDRTYSHIPYRRVLPVLCFLSIDHAPTSQVITVPDFRTLALFVFTP
jgi:hypothetical protein